MAEIWKGWEMRDDAEQAIAAFVLIAILLAGSYAWGAMKCSAKADAMKVRHEFGIMTGCLIEHDGAMVPLENLRVEQ